jgi:hypothetical protein
MQRLQMDALLPICISLFSSSAVFVISQIFSSPRLGLENFGWSKDTAYVAIRKWKCRIEDPRAAE